MEEFYTEMSKNSMTCVEMCIPQCKPREMYCASQVHSFGRLVFVALFTQKLCIIAAVKAHLYGAFVCSH